MQLYRYLDKNKIICDGQFGFRPNYSTELANLYLTDYTLKQIDNNLIPMNIYLDLSKAFDTLDHNILLKNLNTMVSQLEQHYLCFHRRRSTQKLGRVKKNS